MNRIKLHDALIDVYEYALNHDMEFQLLALVTVVYARYFI
jgi:hypothetical protein